MSKKLKKRTTALVEKIKNLELKEIKAGPMICNNGRTYGGGTCGWVN